ncbi:MAG: formate dehydrogenase subunit gamma [Gammaproteobacteria bacterium]|nr:formate dehydrogenase subunit gamma [Gammaproteobacteria bacterium]MDH3857293.1 formate dehydrogenase subunit gamma [Gammaproteobacteria bacterium]
MRIHTLIMMVCLVLSVFQVQAADPSVDPPPPPESLLSINPGSELWREVRQRDGVVEGISQVKSPGANVLVNVSGQSWREYRMQELVPIAGAAILIVLVIIAIFRLLRGRIMLENGRSGVKILRFTTSQRAAHWTTAILFVTLGLTGLILLLGRKFLIPLFGAEGFSNIAVAAKFLHDYLGPVFMLALTWLFVLFVRDNIPSPKLDLQWLLKGGGLFGKHASAGRYNAGEKLWFWLATIVGLAVIISGMVLDFPIFGQARATMEFYHWVHSVSAIILIVVSFGHIYMGTAALEATFEVMKTGYCDANWAKEHHDLWYEKVKDSNESAPQSQAQANTDTGQRESADSAY